MSIAPDPELTVNSSPSAKVEQSELHPKDETYFFPDGDCVLRVEGVYFNLHKAFLSRDPASMFRDMFRLPQCNTVTATAVSDNMNSILLDAICIAT
ncbi:BTB domain-containing protein [Mycena indigotica]|uniref:BTB domain-containing protein n=1 Tax=Mycena indigotica TaxID=2126181 RepID=A0A8H6SHX5_9AGAR|nr:BTB domain-containing protein [Mycena indigotica]KAF7298662.1 BTB domain-containing protein [Mycena indigotica]